MTSNHLNKLFSAALFFVSLFFMSCASLPLKDSGMKFSRKYQMISVDEKLDYLESSIKYPQFENLPELNKRIENTVISNWKNFKSYSKSEWESIVSLNKRGNTKLPAFEYTVNYEATGQKDIISILINTYIFNGGAHGNTSLTTINYRVSTKQYINIRQITDMNYNEISSICRNKLYKKLIDDNKAGLTPSEKDSIRAMINTGAFPQAGNYEIFTVDGPKVFVYFEPYSVAPYSYGIQKVQIK